MGRAGNLNRDRQSSRQRSRTKSKVSVVVTLQYKARSGHSINRNSSHTGRMLILLGDVRRDTTVAISFVVILNPLNPELNPICYLLALLAHHFLHISRIRVKSLTIRLLMSYIYIWSTYS